MLPGRVFRYIQVGGRWAHTAYRYTTAKAAKNTGDGVCRQGPIEITQAPRAQIDDGNDRQGGSRPNPKRFAVEIFHC